MRSVARKTVLLVPGFKETLTSRSYRRTIKAIKDAGYKVRFVPLRWSRTTVDDWVRQLDAVYEKYPARSTVLAGFSFGAVIALVSASKRNPAELWLFSLSPYFQEDIPYLKRSWLRFVGKRRAMAFRQLRFKDFARKVQAKTFLFVGQREAEDYPIVGKRARLAKKLIRRSSLHVVPGCKHDVSDPRYVETIRRVVRTTARLSAAQ